MMGVAQTSWEGMRSRLWEDSGGAFVSGGLSLLVQAGLS